MLLGRTSKLLKKGFTLFGSGRCVHNFEVLQASALFASCPCQIKPVPTHLEWYMQTVKAVVFKSFELKSLVHELLEWPLI